MVEQSESLRIEEHARDEYFSGIELAAGASTGGIRRRLEAIARRRRREWEARRAQVHADSRR